MGDSRYEGSTASYRGLKTTRNGHVSYDPANHELMVKLRAEKVANIANDLPELKVETGTEEGDLLILGWGSTKVWSRAPFSS